MKNICILVLLIGLGIPSFAQEEVADQDNHWYKAEKNRFSVGLNNMPWDVSRLSFRWWRNKYKGHEFTIFISSRADISGGNSSGIHISEIRYDRLWRKRSRYIRGLYHVSGVGLGAGFDTLLKTRDTSSIQNSFDGFLILYVPVGIEHFFLKSFSKLSYSLQVDFYGRVNYRHINFKDDKKDRFRDAYEEEWAISLGMRFQFFIRLYLK